MSTPPISSGADPQMVEELVQTVCQALDDATIDEVTTPADVLSALFTILYRMLKATMALQTPEERPYNVKEIRRVLDDFILEFGSTIH